MTKALEDLPMNRRRHRAIRPRFRSAPGFQVRKIKRYMLGRVRVSWEVFSWAPGAMPASFGGHVMAAPIGAWAVAGGCALAGALRMAGAEEEAKAQVVALERAKRDAAAMLRAVRKALHPAIRCWTPPPKRLGSQGRHAAREIGPKAVLRR